MANFKTALNALARGDLEAEAIAENIHRMIENHPRLAVSIMDQLHEAYSEDLINTTIYVRLKKLVAGHAAGSTPFDEGDKTPADSPIDATQLPSTLEGKPIAVQARVALSAAIDSGKHPFNKLPANSARDNKLVPQPIKALKRKQFRGLMRGLAFARSDRSQSVRQFLEELEGRTSPFKNLFVLVPIAMMAVTLAGVTPALDYQHEHKIEQQIAQIKSGDAQQIEMILKSLNTPEIDPADRDRILVATRAEILGYFQDEVNRRVDIEAGRYNFVDAKSVIDRSPLQASCSSKLAGHGKRKQGTCFDMVSQSVRGPTMVVVPSGIDFARPFAIGKYEVTIGDFNQYCKLSGACEAITDREYRLPITGISFEQASAYAKWLSDRTGNTYRLPMVGEWSYAADAGGQQPRKDYNCRVKQSGQILKGQSILDVGMGKANGWGLYNYVGNAQEWVHSDGGIVVRGGAFEDTFSRCAISLEKPHDGAADDATGFRLLQELG